VEETGISWRARSFNRKLTDDWPMVLQARSVQQSGSPAQLAAGSSGSAAAPPSNAKQDAPEQGQSAVPPRLFQEQEPNDAASESLEISIPALIEGSIDHAGDMDSFKFKVKAGQKLAFEVETPQTRPPHFNPRLALVDSANRQLFSNVHRRVSLYNANSERHVYLKNVEPKALYTFDKEGEYSLEVRDVTMRYGGPSYAYRIMVRRQIPHVGELSIGETDHINLVRGKAHKLNISTLHEEGFAGEVSFSFDGLPKGVQVFPAAPVNDIRAPSEITENAEIIEPKKQQTLVVLLADREAPVTRMPVTIQLYGRALQNGEPGPAMLIREIPMMVVNEEPPAGKQKLVIEPGDEK
jgi:hypothetical protein